MRNTDFTFTNPSTIPAHGTASYEDIFDNFAGVNAFVTYVQGER